MKKLNLKVTGMHCPSCEMLIKDSLEEAGVKNIKINHKTGDLSLEFDDAKLTESKVKDIIKKEGYGVK